MKRALAIVEATEATKSLVAEAGTLAAGVDAELFLLHVTTEDEFQDRQAALESVDSLGGDYGVYDAEQGAERFAENIGQDVLGEDVSFTALGRIGERETEILSVADEYDVDHVFVHGKQRSPAGKAVFGDLAQSIILEFDGPVTITTGGE